MRELPHFHHGLTTSFLHHQPIQTPPSGPGLICAAGQVFISDDPSVTPLSWLFTKGVHSPTKIVVRASCFEVFSASQYGCFWMEACAWQGVGHGLDVWDQLLGGGSDLRYWQSFCMLGEAIPASAYKQAIGEFGVGFTPVIIPHVSFRAVSSSVVGPDRPHDEHANSDNFPKSHKHRK